MFGCIILYFVISPVLAIDQEIFREVNDCDYLHCSGESLQTRTDSGVNISVPATEVIKAQALIPSDSIRPVEYQNQDPLVRDQRGDYEPVSPESNVGIQTQNSPLETASKQSETSSNNYENDQITGLPPSGSAVMGASQPRVRNGLIYSDDSEPVSKKSQPAPQAGDGQNQSVIQNQALFRQRISPQGAQKPTTKIGNTQSPQTASAGFNAASAAPFGRFESANGSAGRAATAAPKEPASSSVLEKIANSLGLDNFFGANGTSASNTGGQNNLASLQKGAKQNPTKNLEKLKDPRAILQAQFDKYNQQRNLASQLEFGSPQSSLFQQMCEHYIQYAKRNRIPNKQNQCDANSF